MNDELKTFDINEINKDCSNCFKLKEYMLYGKNEDKDLLVTLRVNLEKLEVILKSKDLPYSDALEIDRTISTMRSISYDLERTWCKFIKNDLREQFNEVFKSLGI